MAEKVRGRQLFILEQINFCIKIIQALPNILLLKEIKITQVNYVCVILSKRRIGKFLGS